MSMMQLRVVFIDDDMLMLKSLQRTAKRLRPAWEIVLCDTPQQWLQVCQPEPGITADVIVSDYVMPGMTGSQLLQQASQKMPGAIRVLLSGDTSVQMLQQLESYSHFIFAKPLHDGDLEYLFSCAERVFQLPFTRDDRQRLGALRKLPVLPQLILRLRGMLADPDTDLADCADVVAHDAVVSGKLIQYANSALLGFSRKTASLREAITRLGAELTEAVVTTLLIGEDFRKHLPEALHAGINEWAFQHGALCRRMAQEAGLGLAQRDCLFSAALLSAIGRLTLAELALLSGQEIPDSNSDYEEATLVSAYVLSLWGYPADFCQMLLMQDLPTNEDTERGRMAFMLFLSKRLLLDGQPAVTALRAMIESDDLAQAFDVCSRELSN